MSTFVKTILIILALMAPAVYAAHTTAELHLAADAAKPGTTVMAGIQLEMEPGWHTYWKNPGESGQATEIKWSLPPGVSAGEIEWPVPQKLPPAEVTTYGYEEKTLLLVPLTLASNLSPGPLTISAKVSWLECKESCIPAGDTLQATITVGNETKPSANAELIAAAQKKLPQTLTNLVTAAVWENSTTNDTRPMILSWSVFPDGNPTDTHLLARIADADFYPDASEQFEIEPGAENLSRSVLEVKWRKQVKKFGGDWPKAISGLLVLGKGDARIGVEIRLPIEDTPPVAIRAGGGVVASADGGVATSSLWLMLIYAFIGGLILNIMPCVLPVIALKILGFVSEAKSSPGHVRVLGGIYALGVLCSFLVLAGIIIGVKAAGQQAGWGMQFGSPIFLVCLTTLVMLVALNLFGVFEVTLNGGAMNAAGNLAQKSGAPGAFFNGVLATILATPCTAPFLSGALGFAFSQTAGIIVLIFLTVGLGLSAPYILLSWNPAWLKFLPKPGAWMEKFKIAMGFPMLATVVWLFNVTASSYGKNVLWLGIFLVLIAFAAWIFGEFVQRGRTGKKFAAGLVLLLLLGGYIFVLENQLHWRRPFVEPAAGGSLKESAEGIDWQPWSVAAVTAARAAGKIVLVDFTADWCLTCQVNKKTSLEISAVREKIRTGNVAAFLADYTHTPANILTELRQYNRPSVPLVLVYPKNANAAPIVLPEVLTPSLVLNALAEANKI